MINNVPLIDHVLKEEKENFKANFELETSNLSDCFYKGNTLYELPFSSTSLQALLTSKWHTLKQTQRTPNCLSSSHYFNDLFQRIIKVDEFMSKEKALSTIYETAILLGESFAGALLLNGENIINPLHPLSALSLLDSNPFTEYKLIIYTYENRAHLDKMYYSSYSDPDKVEENINLILSTYSSQVLSRKVKHISSDLSGNTLIQKYMTAKASSEDTQYDYFLVTHQVLTKGTFVPYYGTSILRRETKTDAMRGLPISPCLSANIDYRERNSDDSVHRYTSICTGNITQASYEGMRTLTHSNLSSPLNNDCILEGFLPYIDACIAKSFEIYKAAQLIKE